MSPWRLAASIMRPIASACAATCSSNAAASPLTRRVTITDIGPPGRGSGARLTYRVISEVARAEAGADCGVERDPGGALGRSDREATPPERHVGSGAHS